MYDLECNFYLGDGVLVELADILGSTQASMIRRKMLKAC
jgi:hypothetical protein